ncbi:hypothetical protein AMAG_12272 [Allomyces macrogynus ATCC 38327]|uniref:Uncharacterized protein n=1 Tax=Allomyces macrogynus (strain ATCC 38327) TaxID=578462 RepID=A0A0L0SXH0_ALLM3|nr:hypothetical protein AMAG_12272 [Allomyces macrogynus ATCC 38327]|eukprot:KNE67202.1 hypothetical protein AMAG_12272 [Allomyces macrogynus ATCC 38327]
MNSEILLGPVEFAVWQMVTRVVIVATVAQIMYLTVFVDRPGFQVAATLDIVAAIRSLVRFARRSRRPPGKLSGRYRNGCARQLRQVALAVVLLLLAIVSTLVDYGIDIAFAAYQRDRQVTIAWVRPSNASRRISVPSSQFAMPVHRRTANALLQSAIQDDLIAAGDTAWVRSLGALTEAEVMAMRFSDQCGEAMPDDAATSKTAASSSIENGAGWPSAITGKGTVGLNIESLSSQRVIVHGTHQRLYPVEIYDDVDHVIMAVPMPQPNDASPLVRLNGADDSGNGQGANQTDTDATAKQFGATAFGAFVSGYEMSCGQSPEDVDRWLRDHSTTASGRRFSVAVDLGRSKIPNSMANDSAGQKEHATRRTALHYLDYNFANPGSAANLSTGSAAALLVHVDPDRAAMGEYEMLVFGSLTTTTNGTMVSPLIMVSEAVAAAQQLAPKRRIVMQMAVEEVQQTCAKMTGQFKIANGTVSLDNSTSTDKAKSPFAWVKTAIPNQSDPQHCPVTMAGLASMRMADKDSAPSAATPMRESLQYLSGAQVCRISIRTRTSPDPLVAPESIVFTQPGDYVAVARIVQQDQEHRLKCLDPAVTNSVAPKQDQQIHTEPRPTLALGFLSRMWAPISSDPIQFWGQWITNRLDVSDSGGLLADGPSFLSWTDPDGPQQYTAPAVRAELWEILGSLAVLLVTLILAFLDIPSLYDTVVTQLFLWPDLRRTLGDKSAEPAAAVSMVEDLTFAATLVLIEYPAGMDPELARASTEMGFRPQTAFDVQFVHADQVEVWTPFGPIPLDAKNQSSFAADDIEAARFVPHPDDDNVSSYPTPPSASVAGASMPRQPDSIGAFTSAQFTPMLSEPAAGWDKSSTTSMSLPRAQDDDRALRPSSLIAANMDEDDDNVAVPIGASWTLNRSVRACDPELMPVVVMVSTNYQAILARKRKRIQELRKRDEMARAARQPSSLRSSCDLTSTKL